MSATSCIKLLASEFWLHGEKIDDCSAFYILFENRDCLKAYYNDEHCIWELVGTYEKIDFTHAKGGESFTYPYTEYKRSNGEAIGDLISYKVTGRNVLSIEFSSNLTVTLKYDESTENATVQLSA